jgi:Uma2 family endonuclease
MPQSFTNHRFNVQEYYRMAEIGVLKPDARVELLDGIVFDCGRNTPFHAAVKARLNTALSNFEEERWIVSVSGPLRLDEYSEVQPDVMLIKYREDYYSHRHPESEDVYCLMEVAHESLEFDQNEKLSAYARAGIVEAWIIILVDSTIEVYREPHSIGYGSKTILRIGDQAKSQAFTEVAIDLARLFRQ